MAANGVKALRRAAKNSWPATTNTSSMPRCTPITHGRQKAAPKPALVVLADQPNNGHGTHLLAHNGPKMKRLAVNSKVARKKAYVFLRQ
jgi:hypothetical protein